MNLRAIGKRLIHGLAEVDPIVARGLARDYKVERIRSYFVLSRTKNKPCPGLVILLCPSLSKPVQITAGSKVRDVCDGSASR